jgi:hypothetical protein
VFAGDATRPLLFHAFIDEIVGAGFTRDTIDVYILVPAAAM